MSSFVNVFGGGLVQPSFSFYSSIDLNSDITLAWSTDFGNNPLVVSSIIDIFPSANGYKVIMPNATNVSVGFSFSINNKTAFSFTLMGNDGVTPIAPISAASFSELYLTDNSSQNGAWTLIPSLGTSAVLSIGLETSNSNLTISSSTTNPILLGGTFTINLAGDLLALSSLAANTGIATRTGNGTWATRSVSGTTNQISVTNGSGVSGNPTIALAQNIAGVNSIALVGGNLNIGVTPNVIAATNVDGGVSVQSIGSGSVALSATGTGSILLTTVSGIVGVNSDMVLTDESGILFGDSANDTLKLVAPTNIATSYIVKLPGSLPTVNQCLGVAGVSGVTVDAEWLTIPNVTGATLTNTIPYFTNTSGSSASTTIAVSGNDGLGHPTGINIAGTLGVGNIQIATNTMATLSGDIILSPVSPRVVIINANTEIRAGNQLRFYHSGNSFYYAFNAPAALPANYQASLPLNNGTDGSILSSNGLNPATLTWTNSLINLTSASFGVGNISISPTTISNVTSISFGTGNITIGTSSIKTTALTPLTLGTNNITALTIDISQNLLTAGGLTVAGTLAASGSVTVVGSISFGGSNISISPTTISNITSAAFGTNNITISATSVRTTGATSLTIGTNNITAITIDTSQNVTMAGNITLSGSATISFGGSNISIAATSISNIATASFGTGNITIGTTSIKTIGANPLTIGTNNITALTIDTSQNLTSAANLTVTGKLSTAPAVGSSSVGSFVLGTPYQNTFGYDIMLNVCIRVTAGSPVVTSSVSPTSITTGESFTLIGNQYYNISLYVPKQYYAYVQSAGGTTALTLVQAIPI